MSEDFTQEGKNVRRTLSAQVCRGRGCTDQEAVDKETAGLADRFVKALDASTEHLSEPQQAQGFGESRELAGKKFRWVN